MFFRGKKSNAAIAKERLKLLIQHERLNRNQPDFLSALEKDILEIVKKYVKVQEDKVDINIDSQINIVELNLKIPEV